MSDDRNAVLANTADIEKLKDLIEQAKIRESKSIAAVMTLADNLTEALQLIQAAHSRELKLITALRYYANKLNTPEARGFDKALSEIGMELTK